MKLIFEKEENICVRAISLEYVGVVETDADLSALGFTRKEGTNKWFNNKYYENCRFPKSKMLLEIF